MVQLNNYNFDFNKAQESGNDIRFTDNSNNELRYEIESWNKTSEEAKIWVKIPLIDSTFNTTFCMYYGNTDVPSGENSTAVWDNNFMLIQYLQEIPDGTADEHEDSTLNNNHGTGNPAGPPYRPFTQLLWPNKWSG